MMRLIPLQTNTQQLAFKLVLFYVLVLSVSFSHAQTSPELPVLVPVLKGELIQGSLIRGQVAPGTQLRLNGNALEVSKQGNFVFGFGRDAKTKHVLEWQSGDTKTSMPLNVKAREYDIDRIEGVAQKYVSPPEEVLARIRKDNRAIAKARAVRSEINDYLDDFIIPAQGRISGVYGSQRVFNGEPKRPHFGLDVANAVGTPVIAPAGGIITLAHDDMYYSGGTLLMDHGFGISSTFIHLSKIHVKEGQRVEQGDVIAEIGATGRVTGPHLDWRINWYKERLDPQLLLGSE